MLLAMEHAEERDIENLTETLKKIPPIFTNMMKIFKRIEGNLTLQKHFN